ncbi:sulfate adenylyltransferase subunit CysN [Natronoflexus pectinivorans]|uniref:sulfate adenylyltransferase n=1 Tax=Natronoflexus pectinivorans TaxID=682526 RepID=A0A4R2GJG8_9BACT|nr:sulfate adenylyltransferase subunit CysN [Natronoflexus pectinivorans]TCO08881.1 sulfate adenylyltransferase subunit 1 [Natronoflexus pectinivorans]
MSGKNSGYLDMELLRFTTAGSVDDGKSTLIGRLLYDSKAIFEDQMEAIERASVRAGGEQVNLALLTDGLRAEREQGITIDVAYRYFATPKRKFIIADTPGHIQYTRNMVTGASTANVALILVDARHGVLEQTRRHAYIASLLQIPHIIVCVNKMDLVDYDQTVFENIVSDFEAIASKLSVKDVRFVPISALEGDNVVDRSTKMDWYQGPTLMYLLENIHIGSDINRSDFRFPVQYVVRPQSKDWPDYRGYAGRVASGVVNVGDKVTVLPSGFSSVVKSIDLFTETQDKAFAPQSVCITLEDDIDISRGDMIIKETNGQQPRIDQNIDVMLCWFNEKKLIPGGKYALKHTSTEVRCMIKEAQYRVDINELEKVYDNVEVGMNDIARVSIRTTKPLFFDSYNVNRNTGSIILIDEGTNETVAAGMIV